MPLVQFFSSQMVLQEIEIIAEVFLKLRINNCCFHCQAPHVTGTCREESGQLLKFLTLKLTLFESDSDIADLLNFISESSYKEDISDNKCKLM